MKKCGKSCTACPYILEVDDIKIDERTTWKIEKNPSNIFNRMQKVQTEIYRDHWWPVEVETGGALGLYYQPGYKHGYRSPLQPARP